MDTNGKVSTRRRPQSGPAPQGEDSAEPRLMVGLKLKMARKAHRMLMKDLAERVGCSESFISKLENDRVTPSLPMLHKIAKELGLSIGQIISESNPEGDFVSRKGTRPILGLDAIGREGGNGIRLEGLALNGELLYGSIHIIEPGGSSGGFIQHVGEEVAYVLEGEVEITIGSRTWAMSVGDSAFFPSELPHAYCNKGTVVARILWVNTPSTF